MEILFALSVLCVVLRSGEGKEEKTVQRKGRDGWGPGGWETRNGVSSFGWDSRRPISCPRCPQPGEYRGNGYDNLSPEWQQREQGKQWPQGPGVGHGDGYGDKRVWSGTIRPIENPPGGLVTNWMGGPSRWRDPWEQRDVRYWHSTGGGYAGGYGYTEGSSYGYAQVGDNKPTTYYDRSRGETGYINHYDRRPWDDYYPGQQGYARGWDYYEQRPGAISGGGYTYRPTSSYPYDRKKLHDCNRCRERPQPARPAVACCGARPSNGPPAPIGPDYRADFENRYYQNHIVQGGSGSDWARRPGGDINAQRGYDYVRPTSVVTRPSPSSYADQNRPWNENGLPSSSYGGPLTPDHFRPLPKPDYARPGTDYGRPNPDYGRPNPDYSRPSPDYGRPNPDYGRPNPDYGRPSPDYGRPNPDYGRPNPDYGRPNPDYGRPNPDYGIQGPDYGRPDVSKPNPGNYGRPTYNPQPPLPDYGRPTTVLKPSPGDYGRPSPDYNQLPPASPDYGRPDYGQQPSYGRPSTDYGRPPTDYRPQPDYGRPSVDYGRPQPDYGRPPPDYGRPDYSRPPIDYGRPGCSTCRPDPERPQLGRPGSYPTPGSDSNYDGYGSGGGYKPSGSHEYGGDSGSYPAVSGGGNYGAGRPDDPRRDEHGEKSPIDRYPGHTGVGATFEFDSDRKQDSCLPSVVKKEESEMENTPPLTICRTLEDFEYYDKLEEEEVDCISYDSKNISQLMNELLHQAIQYSNGEVQPVKNEQKMKG